MKGAGVVGQAVRGLRTTGLLLVVICALSAGVIVLEWIWQAGSSMTPAARIVGDPTIRLAPGVLLPGPPVRVAVYHSSGPIAPSELREAMGGGKVVRRHGWLQWAGSARVDSVEIMRGLHPDARWIMDDDRVALKTAGPARESMSTGLALAFTATPVGSNFFALFERASGRTVSVSMPAVRVRPQRWVHVLSAQQALDDLQHRRDNATLIGPTVAWLPDRLIHGTVSQPLPPISDMRLVQAADPSDPSKSRVVWEFRDVGYVDAGP